MFKGFSKEAVRFLKDIRVNDNKEWFEDNKGIYTDELYHPMKEFCSEISAPFMKIPGMMSKAGRIYSDPNYPPYRKYRENMWIIVKHEAWDWSKTPSLFFELTGDGAVFGFKITHPAAPVMEKFRQRIVNDDGDFIRLIKGLERSGIILGGDEYKRPKSCDVPAARRFFSKKALFLTVTLKDDDELLYSEDLVKYVIRIFKKLLPVNEMFEEFVFQAAKEKQELKLSASEEQEYVMPKAPVDDFMW